MTIAPDNATPAVGAAGDMTALLPARQDVLDRLAGQLPATARTPATLLVIGLLPGDDGRPTPQHTLAQVTALLARSLRGDDWLACSGPAEFVIVMTGPTTSACTAAERLLAAVGGIPGLAAGAGLAPLTADLTAGEALRRATLSLTAARRVGAGTVIQYRAPY